MDIALHWGLLRHLRDRVQHRRAIVVAERLFMASHTRPDGTMDM